MKPNSELFQHNESMAPINYALSCPLCHTEIWQDTLIMVRPKNDFQNVYEKNSEAIHKCCHDHLYGNHRPYMTEMQSRQDDGYAHQDGGYTFIITFTLWEAAYDAEDLRPKDFAMCALRVPIRFKSIDLNNE